MRSRIGLYGGRKKLLRRLLSSSSVMVAGTFLLVMRHFEPTGGAQAVERNTSTPRNYSVSSCVVVLGLRQKTWQTSVVAGTVPTLISPISLRQLRLDLHPPVSKRKRLRRSHLRCAPHRCRGFGGRHTRAVYLRGRGAGKTCSAVRVPIDGASGAYCSVLDLRRDYVCATSCDDDMPGSSTAITDLHTPRST